MGVLFYFIPLRWLMNKAEAPRNRRNSISHPYALYAYGYTQTFTVFADRRSYIIYTAAQSIYSCICRHKRQKHKKYTNTTRKAMYYKPIKVSVNYLCKYNHMQTSHTKIDIIVTKCKITYINGATTSVHRCVNRRVQLQAVKYTRAEAGTQWK